MKKKKTQTKQYPNTLTTLQNNYETYIKEWSKTKFSGGNGDCCG